ncbi:MAG: 2-enoyl thioester reductase domain-containing protein [Terrimicrobiaceae bacterium]|nr:2-enoyl thioester reductase domain-containing protein [Terrimicrobiaceae bacterium]
MKAAVLHEFGPAGDNLRVEDRQAAPPGEGEVRLEMLAAPVNPADMNILEGKYGELPDLPAVVGNEGAGRVAETGPGVEGLAIGDLVAVLQRGTWASEITLPASEVVRLPHSLDPLQAAMIAVNPPTALLMLRQFATLNPGDWVAQNAANSAVGRCVIQIARRLGLRTLNLVRREELRTELEALGADAVAIEDADLRKEARALCGGHLPKLGLNAVGGASALNLANALAPGSPLVTYGAMSLQPLKIPNGLLIFKGLSFQGFWLTRWKKTAAPAERQALFAEIAGMMATGELKMPVHRIFDLGEIHAALREARQEKRAGKVLLNLRAA